jgi:hypothetical protein
VEGCALPRSERMTRSAPNVDRVAADADLPDPPDEVLIGFLAARVVELESGAEVIVGDGTVRGHILTAEEWRDEATCLRSVLETARTRRATERERQVVDIVLRRLAQPWAHHSDFQPGWRPQ